MINYSERKLITKLIMEHVVHQNLIEGLNAIGFYNHKYCLYLEDTIFNVMGLDNSPDAVHEEYRKMLREPIGDDNNHELYFLAHDIYTFLCIKRKNNT